MDASFDTEVIVVGAGPTGLMVAGELRCAGIDVILLDELLEPTTESRGLGFTPRTMEVLAQRGLVERFSERGVSLQTTTRGHFGGIPLDFGVFADAHPGVVGLPQVHTEAVLRDWVADLGCEVTRGHRVIDVTDTGNAVEALVDISGRSVRLRARFLVGCDGSRSVVRKRAGFEFTGTTSTLEVLLADVRGCDIRPRFIGEWLPGGVAMSAAIGDGIDRIVVCERDGPSSDHAVQPSFKSVADAWQRLTGEDISHGEPQWVSAFGDATKLASDYRRGRVLLAGDAAHVHLPAGGLGMNTGMQDGFNLGWKLAAVVRGRLPETLLDSYHEERHAVGKRLLLNTRAQGLLFLGGDEMAPLRTIIGELIGYEAVSVHLAGMVSGLEIRYPMGTGSHPLLGLRMPDIQLAGTQEQSVYPLLTSARGLLLDFVDDESLRDEVRPWADRIDVVTASPVADFGVPRLDAVLVRPDGHVAWVAPDEMGSLTAALHRWFGDPDEALKVGK
ncbi:FAD-dependent monooxygenase [Rhodococcoides yunnanense]|uniref:FAD-dependent monooxygenase n=1 Tax=Rhodococcoides yunnanense TaxID=278209 RepID=A0ABU4BI99_9NOCA|nr:FAD-dependent monooxygenase [Rhodococcus yunnanensis]MDV6263935.1 FAD-dependent monooxygenase [Rhodococcus yunnanensis]